MDCKKICTICKENKNLIKFSNNKKSKDGKDYRCKDCMSKYHKEYNIINREDIAKKSKDKSKIRNIEIKKYNSNLTKQEIFNNTELKICTTCKKELYSINFHINRHSKDGLNSKCKFCKKTKTTFTNKVCKICNIDKPSEEYNTNTKGSKTCKKCTKEKIKNSKTTEQRIKGNIRNLIGQSFRRACKGNHVKSSSTEDILGCTLDFFKKHLENLFEDGMEWKNNGRCKDGNCDNVWHIDHRIPLSSAETEQEIIKLCHYTNLQPLWAIDNLKKSGNSL